MIISCYHQISPHCSYSPSYLVHYVFFIVTLCKSGFTQGANNTFGPQALKHLNLWLLPPLFCSLKLALTSCEFLTFGIFLFAFCGVHLPTEVPEGRQKPTGFGWGGKNISWAALWLPTMAAQGQCARSLQDGGILVSVTILHLGHKDRILSFSLFGYRSPRNGRLNTYLLPLFTSFQNNELVL